MCNQQVDVESSNSSIGQVDAGLEAIGKDTRKSFDGGDVEKPTDLTEMPFCETEVPSALPQKRLSIRRLSSVRSDSDWFQKYLICSASPICASMAGRR